MFALRNRHLSWYDVTACQWSAIIIFALAATFAASEGVLAGRPAFSKDLESIKSSKPLSKSLQGGDFLSLTNRKPAHLIFVNCTYMPERQGKPLHAIYHVSGRFAANTEAYLIKFAGLKRLKRSCCLWDSVAGYFKDVKGRTYSISMVSPETTMATRKEWLKIPEFEVTVDRFTEEI